jgi:mannose-6-phosphate isomerase
VSFINIINYPIKFTPILKEKIWGGNKLVKTLNKKSTSDILGESWEISDVGTDVSVVSNGTLKGKTLRELIEFYKEGFLGGENFKNFGCKFPLLIKFIDAHQDLSIQVHPNDELSQKRHNSFGKTEMWYVVQNEKNSRLIVGFKEEISSKDYLKRLKNKDIMSVLKVEKIIKGDAFFIKTGTVHAIGAGALIAEIQQTSDITYRIYDFDRKDSEGNKRDLHTEIAIDAINFNANLKTKYNYSENINQLNKLIYCKYFKTNIIPVEGKIKLDYSKKDSFVIFMCVEGSSEISISGNSETISIGETVLIPALTKIVEINSNIFCELLEVSV